MDILSPALSLEETYYAEGLALGQADGAKAGLVEGRRFGLEKGFEKLASMGRLHGRSIVWNSRLPITESGGSIANESDIAADMDEDQRTVFLPQLFAKADSFPPENRAQDRNVEREELLPPAGSEHIALPLLSSGPPLSRLQKHIATLFALTEPESLSVENNEEAVSDFDDRFRRAVAKASIIARIVGEDVDDGNVRVGRNDLEARGDGIGKGEGEGEVEDIVWKGMAQTGDKRKLPTSIDQSGLEVEIR